MTMAVTQGSDWAASINWSDDNGAARDATGFSISAYLRNKLTYVRYFDLNAVWTDPATGVAEISMDEGMTRQVPLGCLSEVVVTVVSADDHTEIFTGGEVEGF